jgi:hypothetical protein
MRMDSEKKFCMSKDCHDLFAGEKSAVKQKEVWDFWVNDPVRYHLVDYMLVSSVP